MKKKKSNNSSTGVFLIVIILIVVVTGYYCFLVNRPSKETEPEKLSPVQEILLKDVAFSYPATVKEVIKYYNELTKCLYNEECTQEELEELAKRQRELYDTALLAQNEWGTHIINLTGEVIAFQESGRKLTGCHVGASTDVAYFEEDGHSFARIPCSYTVVQNSESVTTMHIFLLRKDVTDRWRIYGWDLAEHVNLQEEE